MIVMGGKIPPHFLQAWITYKAERGFQDFDSFDDYLSTLIAFANHFYLTEII